MIKYMMTRWIVHVPCNVIRNTTFQSET